MEKTKEIESKSTVSKDQLHHKLEIGQVAYRKQTGNKTGDQANGHDPQPYSIRNIVKDRAAVEWRDQDGNQKTDHIALSELTLEQPK